MHKPEHEYFDRTREKYLLFDTSQHHAPPLLHDIVRHESFIQKMGYNTT